MIDSVLLEKRLRKGSIYHYDILISVICLVPLQTCWDCTSTLNKFPNSRCVCWQRKIEESWLGAMSIKIQTGWTPSGGLLVPPSFNNPEPGLLKLSFYRPNFILCQENSQLSFVRSKEKESREAICLSTDLFLLLAVAHNCN